MLPALRPGLQEEVHHLARARFGAAARHAITVFIRAIRPLTPHNGFRLLPDDR